MVSTDEGIQIDSSDEHSANARPPRKRTLLSHSNITFERNEQYEKHPVSTPSILRPIITSVESPKYPMSKSPSKSTKKSPDGINDLFLESIEKDRIADCPRLRPVSWVSPAGMKKDCNNEHFRNAPSPIDDSLLSFAKLTDNRLTHSQKQILEMV
jgi:hypothetical protein